MHAAGLCVQYKVMNWKGLKTITGPEAKKKKKELNEYQCIMLFAGKENIHLSLYGK